jgi:hypothetical protein
MKRLKRLDHCLNCSTSTGENINYCPQCGQENVNKRQPFWSILADAITGFFSIDSKTFRSFIPLLFKPGFLTNEFTTGRLVRYVHPARMFITITIIYFILFSVLSDQKSSKLKITLPEERNESPDSNEVSIKIGNTSIDYWKVSGLMQKGITDEEQIADSLAIEKSILNMLALRQVMKTKAINRDAFLSYYKSRLPWIMFAIMPVFAIIMKLAYLRRKRLFIDHLVFAYHYHAFAFLLLTIGLLLLKFWPAFPQWPFMLLLLWYLVKSMMNVYDDSLLKTFLRLIVIILLYLIAGLIAFVFSLLLLFLLF